MPDQVACPTCLTEDDRKRIYKAAFKEVLKEWLDQKFLEFGKWSFWGLSSLAFVAMIYFTLKMHGWQR